mmetsp:Transcript_18799/g.45273  ORF Transcript_18799/g.45273 Transcript_18799/m.45273 type:complete len:285 (-) Transcript_18799:699-1553(-)
MTTPSGSSARILSVAAAWPRLYCGMACGHSKHDSTVGGGASGLSSTLRASASTLLITCSAVRSLTDGFCAPPMYASSDSCPGGARAGKSEEMNWNPRVSILHARGISTPKPARRPSATHGMSSRNAEQGYANVTAQTGGAVTAVAMASALGATAFRRSAAAGGSVAIATPLEWTVLSPDGVENVVTYPSPSPFFARDTPFQLVRTSPRAPAAAAGIAARPPWREPLEPLGRVADDVRAAWGPFLAAILPRMNDPTSPPKPPASPATLWMAGKTDLKESLEGSPE